MHAYLGRFLAYIKLGGGKNTNMPIRFALEKHGESPRSGRRLRRPVQPTIRDLFNLGMKTDEYRIASGRVTTFRTYDPNLPTAAFPIAQLLSSSR